MSEPSKRPVLEVADIFRKYGAEYCHAHPVSPAQHKVMRNIVQCRTAVLGGHLDKCDNCGYERPSYNSCRDRHCPKCMNHKKVKWLMRRLEQLLPIDYFHVVFTIPDMLNPLVLRNKRLIYDILFASASQTILRIAADEKHLGAQPGFTAILHTWGQNLLFHPHLHCVVTGGGLAPDGKKWVPSREKFFLPVRVLSKLFRGKFLQMLKAAYEKGDRSYHDFEGILLLLEP